LPVIICAAGAKERELNGQEKADGILREPYLKRSESCFLPWKLALQVSLSLSLEKVHSSMKLVAGSPPSLGSGEDFSGGEKVA